MVVCKQTHNRVIGLTLKSWSLTSGGPYIASPYVVHWVSHSSRQLFHTFSSLFKLSYLLSHPFSQLTLLSILLRKHKQAKKTSRKFPAKTVCLLVSVLMYSVFSIFSPVCQLSTSLIKFSSSAGSFPLVSENKNAVLFPIEKTNSFKNSHLSL